MKIKYESINFRKKSLVLIAKCNEILESYYADGFDLTLRQLYYQLVSRNVIPNTSTSYQNLGNLVSDARCAGLIDWGHIVDRVRNLRQLPNWDDPSDIINASAKQFHLDWWSTQDNRVEIWVEKEALIGVVSKAGNEYDVPYFTTKGFNSQSEMWGAAQRFVRHSKNNQQTIVLYLGDHDPSGLEMTNDIQKRLWKFGADAEVRRLALNYDQIQKMNLPENPAKRTDSRFKSYYAEFGTESSWELDAISPSEIVDLISNEIEGILDFDSFEQIQKKEKEHKVILGRIVDRFHEVVAYLS